MITAKDPEVFTTWKGSQWFDSVHPKVKDGTVPASPYPAFADGDDATVLARFQTMCTLIETHCQDIEDTYGASGMKDTNLFFGVPGVGVFPRRDEDAPALNLLACMTKTRATDRMTVTAALNHEWFHDVESDATFSRRVEICSNHTDVEPCAAASTGAGVGAGAGPGAASGSG